MFILLFILLYFTITLTLFLLVYILRNILRLAGNKKRGPLPSRFNRALKFLEKEGSVMLEEYEDYLGVSRQESLEDLEDLEKMGLVERVKNRGNNYYRYIGKE